MIGDHELGPDIVRRVLKGFGEYGLSVSDRAKPWLIGRFGSLEAAVWVIVKAALDGGNVVPEQLDGAVIDLEVHVNFKPAPLPVEPVFAMTESALGQMLEDVADAVAAASQPATINIRLPEIQAPDIYVDGGAEPTVIHNQIELPAKAKRTRLARARDGSTVIQKEY